MSARLRKKLQQLFEEGDLKLNGSAPWDIQVHRDEFYPRVFTDGSLGLGESYMEGWWDVYDLDGFIFPVAESKT